MNFDRQSQLKFYSIGIVTKDKERGSDMIVASPIEDFSMLNGPINDQKVEYDVSAPDHRGTNSTAKITGVYVVEAKWIPDGNDNRMTAPDVIKNETVKLYRFGDTDQYYWKTIFREPSIRRLETVLFAVGNISSGLAQWDKESSYWMEWSTHDKHIHIHTANSDGEPYIYDIILDTERGNLLIKDDIGNEIELDSPTSKLRVTTLEDIEYNTKRLTINTSVLTEINSPLTKINGELEHNGNEKKVGNLEVQGSIHATGTIIDDSGNTNHHSH